MKHTVLTALVFLLAQLASAQKYQITDLGPLQPVGINVWGQVAGNLKDHAFLWSKMGGLHDLGLLPGGTFSRAAGINDLGAVAGTADGPATVFEENQTASCSDLAQPILWIPGKGLTTAPKVPIPLELMRLNAPCVQPLYATGINDFDQVIASNPYAVASYLYGYLWNGSRGMTLVSGDYQATANSINNLGVIVGQSLAEGGPSWAVLWKNGVETNLGGLGAESRCNGATSINDQGQVVGWSNVTGAACFELVDAQATAHAFLWDAKTGMSDLGVLPGDASSSAVKISATGLVIGTSGSSVMNDPVYTYRIQVVGRPFVWSRSRGMQDLNDLIDFQSGWTLNTANDINIWGQIVGAGTIDGQTHGFLLTPEL